MTYRHDNKRELGGFMQARRWRQASRSMHAHLMGKYGVSFERVRCRVRGVQADA